MGQVFHCVFFTSMECKCVVLMMACMHRKAISML